VDQSNGRMAQLKRRVEPAKRLAQAGLPGQILGRLIEVNFLDRTVILAGQAFSALLPLIIVVNTISPHPGGDTPAAALARRIGLDPKDVSSLQAAAAPPPSARASIGILGVILAILTATSFARALQRSYELAWRLPPAGLRAAWRPVALVIGLAVYVELLFLFGRLVRGVPAGTLLEDLATFAGAWVVWTSAGWILLGGRVRPRRAAHRGRLRRPAPPGRLVSAQPGGQQPAAVRAPGGGVHAVQLAVGVRVPDRGSHRHRCRASRGSWSAGPVHPQPEALRFQAASAPSASQCPHDDRISGGTTLDRRSGLLMPQAAILGLDPTLGRCW
jgi:hypothetical protein